MAARFELGLDRVDDLRLALEAAAFDGPSNRALEIEVRGEGGLELQAGPLASSVRGSACAARPGGSRCARCSARSSTRPRWSSGTAATGCCSDSAPRAEHECDEDAWIVRRGASARPSRCVVRAPRRAGSGGARPRVPEPREGARAADAGGGNRSTTSSRSARSGLSRRSTASIQGAVTSRHTRCRPSSAS